MKLLGPSDILSWSSLRKLQWQENSVTSSHPRKDSEIVTWLMPSSLYVRENNALSLKLEGHHGIPGTSPAKFSPVYYAYFILFGHLLDFHGSSSLDQICNHFGHFLIMTPLSLQTHIKDFYMFFFYGSFFSFIHRIPAKEPKMWIWSIRCCSPTELNNKYLKIFLKK